MTIESSVLYIELARRVSEIPAAPNNLLAVFNELRTIIQEESKYIVLIFPEYTPHDSVSHLDRLFALADRILGEPTYARLNSTELLLFAFGLFSHDWGMAVSESEKNSLLSSEKCQDFALLSGEPISTQEYISNATARGFSKDDALRDYLRNTSGSRSGARLRKYLAKQGLVFADAVAKIAEGHTLDIGEIRDINRYPSSLSVFGESVNLAALTTYVRIVDLLDIGEDRTPYQLWKFVAPTNQISKMHWSRHRSLSPIAIRQGSILREIGISGYINDPEIFAAIADLQVWIDTQFGESLTTLRTFNQKYDIDLDSRIEWKLETDGFDPIRVKFELDRPSILNFLSNELYGKDELAFIRELLQNSVDAIDLREAQLSQHGLSLKGEIRVKISESDLGLVINWSDNGIGMNEDILTHFFARVGKSWYQSEEASRLTKIDPISRFGVGVLSCFSVTNKLIVETCRDPQISNTKNGLHVEIPVIDGHFCIRKMDNLTIGTTIKLKVRQELAEIITKESICNAIVRITQYVRHKIIIDIDGTIIEAGVRPDINTGKIKYKDSYASPARGESAEKFLNLSTLISFEIGNPSAEYEGHYSVLFPKNPDKVKSTIDSSQYLVEGNLIEFDDIFFTNENRIFVKGIEVGKVSKIADIVQESSYNLLSYTHWAPPTLVINIKKPSNLKFDLSRSTFSFNDNHFLKGVWSEIAKKLSTEISGSASNPSKNAIIIGSCAAFGAIPLSGLTSIIEFDETPILVLSSGNGLVWKTIKEFTYGTEFIEAPFELGYAKTINGLGTESGLDSWEGPDVLFPNNWNSIGLPWLVPAIKYGHRALINAGWEPSEIRIVNSLSKDEIPLICRVWKKSNLPFDPVTAASKKINVLNWLYRESPEALHFPASLSQYAGIGSRYWNVDHPKIKKIITTLTELANWIKQQKIDTATSKKISYYTSNKFYDFLVPSRNSGRTLALDVPNNLLDIAEKLGIPSADRLKEDDFFPKSIDKYKNPYNFDTKKWGF